MTYETIIVDRQDHVVTITLNRPDVLNAQNNPMRQELFGVFAGLKQDATLLRTTEDRVEGARAFVEKRKPTWSGR